ncbi:MAG: RIO1 family regulatory kinase/ATPase [Chloroflexota bacterium]
MTKPNLLTQDDLDEAELALHIRNMPPPEHTGKRKPPRKAREAPPQLADQGDEQDSFDFTYHASRHERQWIVDSLGPFYQEHWLNDVLSLVKGGKEAHVYQCLANPSVKGLDQPYLAAKVYRPRQFRNLRNDHMYREGRANLDEDGREIIDDRMQRAISKRTTFGQGLMHTSWIEHEMQTLRLLHAAGVDVPVPLASGHNAILMGFIGDEDAPAPTLNSIDLDPIEAKQLYARVLRNIEIMLANNRIHGDLSAYNILYWEGEISLIDFPQAIDPNTNSSAFRIFERDVTRVCEYFTRQGLRCHPRRLAADLWTSHGHRLLPDVHPALLDADDQKDRAYWRKISQR